MSEEQKKGIKELLEVVDLAEMLAVKVLIASKDGLDITDLKIAIDPELWAKAKLAVEGLSEVVDEVKDVDMAEGGALATRGIALVKAIAEAVKANKAPVA